MSLIALYKDELIADRRGILTRPHSPGAITTVKKIYVNPAKTMAFASVGQTLGPAEQSVLGEIIMETFKYHKGELSGMDLTASEWFNGRDINVLIITKKSNYYYRRPDPADLATEPAIVRFDSDIPACYGSGNTAASVAMMEGVPMKRITDVVADVINSVSHDGDYFHRRTLKGFKV